MSEREYEKARRFGENFGADSSIMFQKREMTVEEAKTALACVKKKYPGLRAYMQGLRIRRAPGQES